MASDSGAYRTFHAGACSFAPAALALSLLGGCAAEEVCAALPKCGGDIVGSVDADGDGFAETRWVIGGACTNQVFVPPLNASLVNQSPPVQGVPPPEPAHSNWCSQMTITRDKTIQKINPWFPAIPVRDGAVTYSADGSYNVQINYFAQQLVEFPGGCFTGQGFSIVSPGTVSTSNTMTCAEFEGVLQARLATEPNIAGLVCGPDGKGGCNCLYDLLMVTGSNGTWIAEDGVVTHYDRVTGVAPSRADFCVNGGTLDLSGHERTFLFNQPHLRSIVLARPQ